MIDLYALDHGSIRNQAENIMSKAKERLQFLKAQEEAQQALTTACTARDAVSLAFAIERAIELLPATAVQSGGEVAEARALLQVLEREEEASRRLKRAATRARSILASTDGKYGDDSMAHVLGELHAALFGVAAPIRAHHDTPNTPATRRSP